MNTLSFKGISVGNAASASPAVSLVISAFKQKRFPLEIDAVNGALMSILLTLFFQDDAGPYLVVAPTENEALTFSSDLESLGVPSRVFPWWGALPYRDIALSSPVFGERCALLSGLVRGKAPVVIASQRAFLTPLPPPEYLRTLFVTVKTGGQLDTIALAAILARYGYTRVPRVQVHGEFALRGEVLDIFMTGDDAAYRVQFDFNHVESIRRFDPHDQSGQEKVSELVIRPLKEVVWSDERIEALSANLAAFDEFTRNGAQLLESLMEKRTAVGEELFFPLAFSQSATLLDYLGPNGTVIYLDRERLENAREAMEREYHKLFSLAIRKHEVPRPERILLEFRTLFQKAPRRVSFMTMTGGGEEGATRCSAASEPGRSFFGNINYLKEEFAALMQNGWSIFVATESDAQAGRMEELLSGFKIGSEQKKPKAQSLTIMPYPLSAGFSLPDVKLIVIEENEIFGRRKRAPRSLKTTKSMAIDTFVELNPGDYVVHVNYGIGLFKGIERVKALGNERDYIKLEYQDAEVVFVPIEQVNLVQRYIGNQGAAPRLDKLGSKSWENRKGKVKKSVEDLAEQLITLYSKRKQLPGFAFPRDTEWQTMFEAAFPYEETEDQLRCVEEIKADMESPHPMDRLVCGDVGYGKTEVAVRACFKAVMGGKQTAFLAPTTILAEQHFENFQERFTQFPVHIAMLSRFVEKAAAKKTIEAVKNGEIDLLVGTHRIIQKDVVFKNLGLIVIDEEQRFGVKDKERLKQFKTNVDCLTLSATPIPRTLHMSLLKIRDMSLLSTPPQNRHPIETVVEEYDEERVALAIRREVERGGQIFFLHNRIEDLDETRIKLERLVPEMLVDTAHGQMNAQELEDVMHRFIHGGFHVLVSTTIIENGIDIPNVNTIIIDRADMYGVSQLYQLRGRVGRSDRVAYAYLFYPKDRALSELAMKRLQVISDFTELGAGFKIAMKDMEIRGAGNLLGREQSGDIYSVGFDLYLRLLDEAIHRLEDEHYEAETETLMELEYTGFIPDSYIEGPQEKMEVYKKIAAVREKEELDHVYTELLDRFGPLPDEAASLLALAELRVLSRDLAIASLKERAGLVRVEFAKVSHVSVERLLRLIKESRGKVKLDPHAPNVLMLTVGAIGLKEKSEFIREKLAALAG
ncbi:MAG: transcription-repair coupling factor [Treponema sp.]|jgi:transcription-repair coupling factor (superfamily II helicase)|nr:transcription-repair coupling factor [Treponema sp.]